MSLKVKCQLQSYVTHGQRLSFLMALFLGIKCNTLNKTADSVPPLPVTSPKKSVISVAKRTSFVKEHKPNPNDFMSNTAPMWPEPETQWPEPEENIGTHENEFEPFIRHHHSTFDPQVQ